MNINDLMHGISNLVGTDPQEALRVIKANKVELDKYLNGRLNKSGFLIDIGSNLEDEAIIMEGLDGITKFMNDLSKEPAETQASLYPPALYNFANGFSALSTIERKRSGGIISPDNETYQKTKELYRMGFAHSLLQDDAQGAKLRINYGNVLSSMGRSLEAIHQFEEAIRIDPNNPIGIGNLGVELALHSRISGDPHLLVEAKDLLLTALGKKEAMIEIAGAHIEGHYKAYLDWVTRRMDAQRLSKEKPASLFEKFHKHWRKLRVRKPDKKFLEMCKENELFLNFGIRNRGSDFIADTIFPYSLTAGMEDDVTIPRLLRTVNEIKERYATARFSLFEALHPLFDLSPYENMTYYADTLDYAAYGLRVAKVKFALENAFNILDKIAFFLDYYLELKMDENSINFFNIWTEKINGKRQLKKSIHDRMNSKLMGLYDLSIDLTPEGYLYPIRKSRNVSTHRYLIPHVEGWRMGTEIDGEDYHLMYEELTEKTIKVLQIARAAVIYMIALINEEESKKKSGGSKSAPVIYPPYEHFNFNPANP